MGVPKFFRYMSERYPCLSEFVKEYQIPVFDNLYLDMNGIIHMCSHPDDNNPHFRITEEKLFADIFHYIEVLFRMIKPRKVFFMAIDGVAPRAKMNQQRGRRFRSAKDAEKSENEAKRKGEKLPEVARFDSNCITPGTEFMAKLHEQLKYFVVNKVSTDKMWKSCKIILSGHETPGEGEHKIMDYIRYIKSQPGYDPNTRHCLYGLDADLIMLGLCTHEPHFSLLREEVKFGKKSTKRMSVPEEIRFYLLHLSLMREYLELEFTPLKEKLEDCSFDFDIEKIIDDWILMGFLVGNDFIPHLPNLHIANGALPILYKAYMEILPTLDGYINEAGTLNLERFEKFMRKLGDIDLKNFEEIRDDMIYMRQKTGRKHAYHTPVSTKYDENGTSDETDFRNKNIDPALAALIQETDDLDITSEEEDDEEDTSSSDEDIAFKQFKDEYYRNKLEYHKVTRQVMQGQAEGYVRAVQWNLNYYYNGVCSWSWYYPHHYSPYISDIKGFANLKIDFELGKPFQPYEQLLAVLPAASKSLLPECYHKLMTDEKSLIKDYYPEDFQTDLNGKKQEWEAVVLVPFIDETVLLEAMKPCNEELTPEEVKRNTHGPMLIYKYTDDDQGVYEAPAYFPAVSPNHAHCTPVYIQDIRVPKEKLIKGVYPGAKFDVFYPGFPTMKHLKYRGELKRAKVKVFEQNSRNENMILKLAPSELYPGSTIPENLLGTTIWVGWPHLVEAKVVGISNEKEKYVFDEKTKNTKIDVRLKKFFDSELEGVSDYYFNRMGIDFGNTEILIHVRTMTGRKYVFTQNGRINLEKQFTSAISNYPIQSVVTDIKVHDECHTTFREITDVFPVGSLCFATTLPYYGSMGTVLDSTETLANGLLKVSLSVVEEPNLKVVRDFERFQKENYYSLLESASPLAISNNVFSRITGSLFVEGRNDSGEAKSVNIGLDLKFNKKNQETPGYTKKIENYWYYSQKTIDLVGDYHKQFPEVFTCLSRKQYSDSGISVIEIFGKDGDEKIKEIQSWLKSLPTHNIERRVCNSVVLESETIKKLEEVVDDHLKKSTSKNIVLNYKPYHLYKPEIQMGNLPPDPRAKHEVFDRIINIREGYTVPLGLKGTIIAKYEPVNTSEDSDVLYDIVFDKPFAGGMVLNCSENRGYRLPKTSFINISYGQRQMEERTGKPGELRAKAKERQSNPFQLSPNKNPPAMAKEANSAFAPFNKTYNAQPKPQQVQNKFNNKNQFQFMSDFGIKYDVRNHNNKENTTKVQGNVADSPKPSKNPPKPKVEEKKIVPVVDTEFLKKVLKIDASPSGASTSKSEPPLTNFNPPPQMPVQNVPFTNAASATAKLLTYYQMNALGCPRYTYFGSNGVISAQVVLPDQKVIVGKEAKSREEASENVAKAALTMIQLKSSTQVSEAPPRFPVPPRKWVQQNNPQQMFMNRQQPMQFNYGPRGVPPEHYTRPFRHSADDKRRVNKPNCTSGSSNTNVSSFVPLQVIKKRQANVNDNNAPVNKGESSASTIKNGEKKDENQQNVIIQPKKEVKQVERKNKDCKQGPRKTRIAANFIANK